PEPGRRLEATKLDRLALLGERCGGEEPAARREPRLERVRRMGQQRDARTVDRAVAVVEVAASARRSGQPTRGREGAWSKERRGRVRVVEAHQVRVPIGVLLERRADEP